MDIRRVQMTGGSSYVLTLPKHWIQSLRIHKNDPLGVEVQDDGDLLITGNITGEVVHRKKIIEIEPRVDPTSFFRTLVGVYIAGYNSIDIRSKDRIPSRIKKTIRDYSDQVIGLEPVEVSDTRVLLRDLFNPLEMPFENSMRRMYTITRGMHTDSVHALVSGDIAAAEDVVIRDRDVDRLFWLVARQTNMILQNPRSGEKIHAPINEVLHYFQTARIIERVADHAVLMAKSIMHIDRTQITKETGAAIKAASGEAAETFDKSITAFFTHDLKLANRIIESIRLREDIFHQLNTEILLLPTDPALSVRKISDSIRRIGEYSTDIAEEVINYGVLQSEEILH
ncbi:MAG TPA: phosphate uptake regulator PhoU [Methanospirillum sp.]|nr:phosphate uptake regulator PhoU [Methanospirillum sp.]